MTYWRYLVYLLRHKWFVFEECVKLGIPWLGIIHDLSKFSLIEFGRSAQRYCGNGEPSEIVKYRYKTAWLHHQKHNKHHWFWWVVYTPIPGQEYDETWGCLAMPDRYRKEMLADWRGSGRTFGRPDTQAWYLNSREKMLLNPKTRHWVGSMLCAGLSKKPSEEK